MPPKTTTPVDAHRTRLRDLRAEAHERITRLTEDYDALAELGTDVGSGDDEGGSESDGTFVERDRIRAQLAEDNELLEEIDAALARSRTKRWDRCGSCGEPIGDARLEALPTTSLCVTCKAARTSW